MCTAAEGFDSLCLWLGVRTCMLARTQAVGLLARGRGSLLAAPVVRSSGDGHEAAAAVASGGVGSYM